MWTRWLRSWFSLWRRAIGGKVCRKIHDRQQEQAEFDYLRIRTEEQLLALPILKLTKFEFRKALERFCIKQDRKLTFEKTENDLKKMEKEGINTENISRFVIKAFVDGKQVGEGQGSNIRIATSYACWRGLKECGVYDSDVE